MNQLKIIKIYFINKFGEERGQTRLILFQRLSGVLLFGIIPVWILLLRNDISIIRVLKIQFNIYSFLFILIAGSLAVLLNYFVSRSDDNLLVYPQIRAKVWTFSLLILSALSWIAYLFAYELLFRGILLFSCVKEVGNVNAIIFNVVLYSLVHIPKGKKEAFGAVPLGIVLCIITLYTGTIWAAFWIHCSLALSNEWFSIKYHPEMKLRME